MEQAGLYTLERFDADPQKEVLNGQRKKQEAEQQVQEPNTFDTAH